MDAFAAPDWQAAIGMQPTRDETRKRLAGLLCPRQPNLFCLLCERDFIRAATRV
jgi:hypothetical protein